MLIAFILIHTQSINTLAYTDIHRYTQKVTYEMKAKELRKARFEIIVAMLNDDPQLCK